MFFQKSWEFILKKYWCVKKTKKEGQKNIGLDQKEKGAKGWGTVWKKKIEHLFFSESFICTVPGSHSFYSQEAGEMCSPLNELGRSHKRQTQEIITTLSPFLASLVPSSVPTVVKVAFQILKLCWDSEAGESQKSVWAIDPTGRMGEINITFRNSCICVSECLWVIYAWVYVHMSMYEGLRSTLDTVFYNFIYVLRQGLSH